MAVVSSRGVRPKAEKIYRRPWRHRQNCHVIRGATPAVSPSRLSDRGQKSRGLLDVLAARHSQTARAHGVGFDMGDHEMDRPTQPRGHRRSHCRDLSLALRLDPFRAPVVRLFCQLETMADPHQ